MRRVKRGTSHTWKKSCFHLSIQTANWKRPLWKISLMPPLSGGSFSFTFTSCPFYRSLHLNLFHFLFNTNKFFSFNLPSHFQLRLDGIFWFTSNFWGFKCLPGHSYLGLTFLFSGVEWQALSCMKRKGLLVGYVDHEEDFVVLTVRETFDNFVNLSEKFSKSIDRRTFSTAHETKKNFKKKVFVLPKFVLSECVLWNWNLHRVLVVSTQSFFLLLSSERRRQKLN